MTDEQLFLESTIFKGLINQNDGFDAPGIFYFTENDFRIVLERIKALNLGVIGIEPWKNKWMYDVLTHDDFDKDPTDSDWYFLAFQTFIDSQEDLLYAATYLIPDLEKRG